MVIRVWVVRLGTICSPEERMRTVMLCISGRAKVMVLWHWQVMMESSDMHRQQQSMLLIVNFEVLIIIVAFWFWLFGGGGRR